MTESPGTRPVLVADSSCDLPLALLESLGVEVLSFPFVIDGVEHLDDMGRSMPFAEFYARERAGAAPTTAQIPLAFYLASFRGHAQAGRPVLHLTLSSGLSGTFETALSARDMVLAESPGARIEVIDSLNGSVAEGLLVLGAAKRLAAGDSLDDVAAWALEARHRVHGFFTVETLEHLRRGGRISDVAALAGTVLDVKPVLRIDREGRLVVAEKVRGRRRSIKAIVESAGATRQDGGDVIVGHSDAGDEAVALRAAVEDRTGAKDIVDADIGPVIGSHTGPGMVAVAVWGPARN